MSLPLDQRPLTGCRFEATPTPAAEYGARPGAAFPAHVDLRAYCSPVEDQSRTNSCTANAIVGALEYLQRRNGQPATDLSRLFVYYNARQLAGAEGADVGSFIHHVMAAVLAHGACEERMWPFQEAMCLVRPTQAAYRDAQRFQAVQYARTPLGDAALAALASGLPVVFGTYAPRGHYDVAGATGTMPGPGATLERPGGGHAMLLVGYDLGREEWLVRNSWGPRWAEGGYFRIPFATLRAYSDPAHFWTIGAIDAAPMLLGKVAAPTAEALGGAAQPSAPTLDTARLRADARSAVDDLRAKTQESRQSLRDRLRGN